jgi:hypothetical protein
MNHESLATRHTESIGSLLEHVVVSGEKSMGKCEVLGVNDIFSGARAASRLFREV